MPSLEALPAAVEKAAAALRALGVEVQDDDERKARELAKHVLQVYAEHDQQISKVLCVVGDDDASRVLLVLGWALKTAGVELQLVSTDPALRGKLRADDADVWCTARSTRSGVQLVLAGDVASKILKNVHSVTWVHSVTTPERGPGFPRALATVQSWAPGRMGKPQDTTLVDGRVEWATLPEVEGFVLGKAFDEYAKFLGEASARATPRTRSPSPPAAGLGVLGALAGRIRTVAGAVGAALGAAAAAPKDATEKATEGLLAAVQGCERIRDLPQRPTGATGWFASKAGDPEKLLSEFLRNIPPRWMLRVNPAGDARPRQARPSPGLQAAAHAGRRRPEAVAGAGAPRARGLGQRGARLARHGHGAALLLAGQLQLWRELSQLRPALGDAARRVAHPSPRGLGRVDAAVAARVGGAYAGAARPGQLPPVGHLLRVSARPAARVGGARSRVREVVAPV